MTALVHQLPHETPVQPEAIPPHVLTVGKKRAVEYIAPALFRLGAFGELLVKARGSLSIATAVDVAEMVKRDITGLAQAITIGTTEMLTDGIGRAVSFIEISLSRGQPAAEAPAQEAQATEVPAIVHDAPQASAPEAPQVTVFEAPQVPALEAPAPVPALAAPVVEAPKKKKKKKSVKKKSIKKTATKKKTVKKKKKSRS